MESINDYAEKYAGEVFNGVLEHEMAATNDEIRKLIYRVVKTAYARGYRDAKSIEWQHSIKRGGEDV